MQFPQAYREKIYAGTLGKLIGVYLGIPVEGWPYSRIQERYGEIDTYVQKKGKDTLVVADDDISGMFCFFKSMADNGYDPSLSSREIGETWLNYLFEKRTVLWWGGIGNSVEHTAYFNLKNGIFAPESGSSRLNGPVMASQIGAEIFMDAYAMMCPGDPEKAAYYAGECARVSHDGIAVEAACFLAAMEALAFEERDLDRIFDEAFRFVKDASLRKLIDDVRLQCSRYPSDWKKVRSWIAENHGYDKYRGSCPIETNHAVVLASILLGGDDFRRSLMISVSSGWDTDCNAANVGCFNGIRLSLEGIDSLGELRTEPADRMYVVSADGGSCVTDAVIESRKIIEASARLRGEESGNRRERVSFEFPGAVQGFTLSEASCGARLFNASELGRQPSLAVSLDGHAEFSTPTFTDPNEKQNRETVASPTLYGTQTVEFGAFCIDGDVSMSPFIEYYGFDDVLRHVSGDALSLEKVERSYSWTLPDLDGQPICAFGFSAEGKGTLSICHVDWKGAPKHLGYSGILMKDMWDSHPFWAGAFVSSAVLSPNLNHTFCITHDEDNGLATTGTADFRDYRMSAIVTVSLHREAGLVARSCGHRRYYAALLRGQDEFAIVRRRDREVSVLASTKVPYSMYEAAKMTLEVDGCRIKASFNGVELSAEDEMYSSGAAGFEVSVGTMFVDDFNLESL